MRYILYLSVTFISFSCLAQFKVPTVNAWRVHLSYLSNQTMAQAGNTYYVGSNSGLFKYDKDEGSLDVYSRVNGLSDVEVKKVAYDETTKTLVIVYNNTNIDLLQYGRITNISNILTQSIIGEKLINDIFVADGIAYLACTFGVVKIDLTRKQIVDSYQNIGPDGTTLNVKDIALFNGFFYISSALGIFKANANIGNLSDYSFWNRFDTLTVCNQLVVYNNKLYTGSHTRLYAYDGITNDSVPGVVDGSGVISNLRLSQGRLVVVAPPRLVHYANTAVVKTDFHPGYTDAVLDEQLNFSILLNGYGLLLLEPSGTRYIIPQGPYGNSAIKFAYSASRKQLFVAGGFVDGVDGERGWSNTYNNNKYYVFNGTEWLTPKSLNNAFVDRCRDISDVVCDDKSNRTYLNSYGTGVLEVSNLTPTNLYDTANTNGKLGFFVNEFAGFRPVYAAGNALDEQSNLWVTCFGAAKPLSLKTASGQWYSFSFNGGNNNLGRIVCDNTTPRNNKWITNVKGGGLYVYNEGDNVGSENDDKFTILTTEKGKGALPSKNVLCMALDKNGEMWIGTDKGLCIISDPTGVFKNRNYDARQLIFNTGSFNSIFLGTDAILSIKVDGANRKWIATRNGVWLVSEDGYTVIRNFTTDNSPLLSNVVYDIGIFEETGEVFFATEKGIISYAGDATDAGDKHKQVFVYPNPVKPEFNGEIAIRGLANESNVKITDMAGHLVYETKANGGMATWNGKTFNGKRAATGVYLIYSSNEDATETFVTKLLFVN